MKAGKYSSSSDVKASLHRFSKRCKAPLIDGGRGREHTPKRKAKREQTTAARASAFAKGLKRKAEQGGRQKQELRGRNEEAEASRKKRQGGLEKC